MFLDEVGELPLATQAKLLRVIETREVARLGSVRPHRIDVRFIAATNRDLEAEVARGAFRADLYYRLNGITLTIPPLRVRLEEIRPLAETFARQICRDLGRPPPLLPPSSVAHLEAYGWPGNIRELKNVIERAVLLCEGQVLEPQHLPLERSLTESQKLTAIGGRPGAQRARSHHRSAGGVRGQPEPGREDARHPAPHVRDQAGRLQDPAAQEGFVSSDS